MFQGYCKTPATGWGFFVVCRADTGPLANP